MSYDHPKFVHLVPEGYIIPMNTQVRRVDAPPYNMEAFFTTPYDFSVSITDETKYYLDYDITKPKLPTKITSAIYNVITHGRRYPVAVYQGFQVWCAFVENGGRMSIYSSEIESFDTTPPEGGGTMTTFDYDKFTFEVPEGTTLPAGSQVRAVHKDSGDEQFFTTSTGLVVVEGDVNRFYTTYDITRPKLPEKVNSVIYNVKIGKRRIRPVAVRRLDNVWSAFTDKGYHGFIYSEEIESFDLTPPEEGESCNHNWQLGAWQALCCLNCGDLTHEGDDK